MNAVGYPIKMSSNPGDITRKTPACSRMWVMKMTGASSKHTRPTHCLGVGGGSRLRLGRRRPPPARCWSGG